MMKVILKTYKYRMYPNKEQQQMLAKYFGSVRFVYNINLNLISVLSVKSISIFSSFKSSLITDDIKFKASLQICGSS